MRKENTKKLLSKIKCTFMCILCAVFTLTSVYSVKADDSSKNLFVYKDVQEKTVDGEYGNTRYLTFMAVSYGVESQQIKYQWYVADDEESIGDKIENSIYGTIALYLDKDIDNKYVYCKASTEDEEVYSSRVFIKVSNKPEESTEESTETTKSIEYRVNYYTRNLDGKNYSLYRSRVEHETIGYNETEAETYVYVDNLFGFEEQESGYYTVSDGSIIDIYYERLVNHVIIIADDGVDSYTGDGEYKYGEEFTIKAKAKQGYEITNIYGGTEVSENTFLMMNTDTYIYIDTKKSDIKPSTQKVTANKSCTKLVGEKFKINAKTTGDGVLTYISSNKYVASVDKNGNVVLNKAGKAKITVNASKTNLFERASYSFDIVVVKGKQNIKCVKSITKKLGDKPLELKAKATGKLKYSTSNNKVASVDSKGKVKFNGVGECTLTLRALATEKVNELKTTIKVKVNPSDITVQKVVKGKGSAKVYWKVDKKCSGYELQYSNNKFKNSKKVKITKSNVGNKTISKLSKGKRYSVKIRKFTKVKGKVQYSKWSKTKDFVTK